MSQSPPSLERWWLWFLPFVILANIPLIVGVSHGCGRLLSPSDQRQETTTVGDESPGSHASSGASGQATAPGSRVTTNDSKTAIVAIAVAGVVVLVIGTVVIVFLLRGDDWLSLGKRTRCKYPAASKETHD